MKLLYFIIFIIDLYSINSINEEKNSNDIDIKNIANKINDIINLDREIYDLIEKSNSDLNNINLISKNISKQLNNMKSILFYHNKSYFLNLILCFIIIIFVCLLIYFIKSQKEKNEKQEINKIFHNKLNISIKSNNI